MKGQMKGGGGIMSAYPPLTNACACFQGPFSFILEQLQKSCLVLLLFYSTFSVHETRCVISKAGVDQVDLPHIPRLPYPGPHEATCATPAR